nr:MAG: putative RNA dependent RNA polymerase [Inner Mongolia grassland mitovirus 7]
MSIYYINEMIDFKNLKFSSKLIHKESFSRETVLISLESSKAFISFLMKYSFKIIKLSVHRDRKVVARVRMFHNFGRYLLFLNKHHGSLFVVKYLKASQLAVQRKLAGQPFSSLRELEPDFNLPRLAKSGLPAFIGSRDRRAILSSSYSVIQMWLSLFGIYRVLKAPCIPKLETITSKFSGNQLFLDASLGIIEKISKVLIRKHFKINWVSKILPLESSSPNSKKSFLGLVKDAVSLRMKGMDVLIEEFMLLTNNIALLDQFKLLKLKEKVDWSKHWWNKPGFNIGQFAFKEEAAGKLRVFAMVDLWTQSLMKPLHDSLFSVLRKLPNDGTFDQNASFDRAVVKSHLSGCCFGYDLSAATDRLPLVLQVSILKPLIGDRLADLWGHILVDRPYAFHESAKHMELSGSLKYQVGQPMGALSSWAMLALTHHLIMQYCSLLLGKNRFQWNIDYEVLGDDIVIFDKALAAKYVELMNHFGVPLNQSKSVISLAKQPVVEFAKRTSYNTVDVSPISWKMFLNQDTFAGRISIVNYWWQRHKDFIFSSFKTILQVNLWDNRPLKNEHSYLSLLTSMANKGLVDLDWILAKISEKKHLIQPFGRAVVINFPFEWAKQLLVAIGRGKDLNPFRPYSYTFAYSLDQRYHSAAVRKEIKRLLDKYNEVFFANYVNNLCKEFHTVYLRKDFHLLFFSTILLFRSYRFINLNHFEFDQLMKIYQQLLNETAKLRLLEEKRNKTVITNNLAILKFIEKANKKSNRQDPNICPLTFVTYGQIMITGFQQRH